MANHLQVQPAAPMLPGYFNPLKCLSNGRNEVWTAHDARTGQKVVIKALSEHHHFDPLAVGRFWMDFDCGQLIQSRCTVPSYELVDTIDCLAFSMEAVPGLNLMNWLPENDLLVLRVVVRIAIEMAAALEAVHSYGIVHCDIKLGNFVMDRCRPRLIDFEMAQFEGKNIWSEAGVVSGSFHYCSPEQARGVSLDRRSDIYSLGICLFRLLSGYVPFSATTGMGTVQLHLNAPLPDVRNSRPDMPTELAGIVERCCEKHPDDRFQTASELKQALESVTL